MSYETPLMHVYGLGGCGINIMQTLQAKPRGSKFIDMKTTLVDTSTSNYRESSGLEFFKIPGLEGTGKNVALAVEASEEHIENFLQNYRPGTINVLVFSGGGGTGSGIGYSLLSRLIERNIPAIALIVASKDSGKEAENSYKCIMRLQKIVKDTGKVVPYMYFENDDTDNPRYGVGSRSEVDDAIYDSIQSIAELFSEKHDELDREDLVNFLNYNKVTKVKPQLTEMVIAYDNSNFGPLEGKIIATAGTFNDRDLVTPDCGQQYQANGYYRGKEETVNKYFLLTAMNNVNFVEHLKTSHASFKSVEKQLNEVQEIEVDDDDLF
jgi:hypothetical protein